VATLPADDEVPARQRLSAEDRRSAIIDAARVLFARNGFRGTGTSDIAAAAGCSEPIIYKHFASKQALFAAVLEDCTRMMGERFAAAAAEGGDLFTAYLRFVSGLMGDPKVAEVARLRYLAVTLTNEPEIRASLSHMMSSWHSGVSGAVAAGQANGRIRADADVESVSMLFLGLGLAAGFVGAIDGEGALECFPRHVDALVDLLTPIQGGPHG
jgi:AcrR family transcriptional regulator